MSVSLRQRRDVLLDVLDNEMGSLAKVSGGQSGMHVMVDVHNGMTQDELARSAQEYGVRVYKTARCWLAGEPPRGQVMIGFSSINVDDIHDGVRALKKAWFR